MSALILRSINHAYKIFKVYLTIATCGVLGVILVSIVLAKPMALLVGIGTFIFLMMGILLWVQTSKFAFSPNLEKRFSNIHTPRPPRLPESIMAIAVPATEREVVIGDLREEFGSLDKKYGRASATAWYVIQATLFVFNLSFIEKFHARLERTVLGFMMFILCIYGIHKLIRSDLTTLIEQILR